MYFLHFGGARHGPYSHAQVREMWERRMLAPNALYWHPQLSQWRSVMELLQAPQASAGTPPYAAPARSPAAPGFAPLPAAGSRQGLPTWVPILAGSAGVGFLVVLVTLLVNFLNASRSMTAAVTAPTTLRTAAAETPAPTTTPPLAATSAPRATPPAMAMPPSGPISAPTATQIAEQTLSSTVVIRTDKSQGSGFLVAANTVATNYHVINGAHGVVVRFSSSNAAYPVVRPLSIDKVNDLALLEVKLPDRTALALGPNEDPHIGDDIYVIGSPEGLANTFSKGNISQFRRSPDGNEWLQFTAPISPGSSGGPLLNTSGEVIGITVATLTKGQNLNFAVPVRYVRKLLSSVKNEDR